MENSGPYWDYPVKSFDWKMLYLISNIEHSWPYLDYRVKISKEKHSSLFLSLNVVERDRELLASLKTLDYPKTYFQAQNTLAYFYHWM
jgi:hypothetical protein